MQNATRQTIKTILAADASITSEARAAVIAAIESKGTPAASTPTTERILRRNEVAKLFSVTVRALDGWVRKGIIKKVTLPGHIRSCGIRQSDVAALIAGGHHA